jgi:hypothetical protein
MARQGLLMPTENHIAAPLKVERSTVTKLVITGAPLLRLGFINLKTRQDMRQQTAGAYVASLM